MDQDDIAVGIYSTHLEAEGAIKSLQNGGFDMSKLSIIGKDYSSEENVVGYFNTRERVKFFGKWGVFWGGLAGILFGAAFVAVPVLGTVVVLGPIASTILGGLQGAIVGGGVSAIAGVLMGIGIPRDSVLRYDSALKADRFLLIVHGTDEEISRARALLHSTGVELEQHSVTA
ncbi:MAG TPA: hypothetical protein VE907_07160 [Gammaproteobacteria bacterium]|nr:hypothetical protein [Gammaproteobacteria bacterium]